MNRGDVFWTDVPGAGRRPYLVLTRDDAIPLLTQVLGVPATRRARGIPTEVPLTVRDGMPQACVLTLDNVRTLDKAWLGERICSLSAARLRDVCVALGHAVDCS